MSRMAQPMDHESESNVECITEVFRCFAEDTEHAIEQAKSAYPSCKVFEVKPYCEARISLKFES